MVGRIRADKRTFLDFLLDLSFADFLQLFQFNRTFNHTECYDCLFALKFHNCSGRNLSFQADIVAHLDHIAVECLFGSRCILVLLFTLFPFLQLRHLAGDLVIFFSGRFDRSLKLLQRFTGKFGLFLFGLCFLDFTNRILDSGISFGQYSLRFGFRFAHDFLSLPVHLFQIFFVTGGDIFQFLFLLADILPFAFPVTFIADNILQVFIHINIIRADFG